MSDVGALARVRHIKDSIGVIKGGLSGKTLSAVHADRLMWSGFERQLEVISEASRAVPAEWKSAFGPDIDWHGIANLGNLLRHAYHRANVITLWAIYENDLDPLEAAIDAMLAAHEPATPPRSPSS